MEYCIWPRVLFPHFGCLPSDLWATTFICTRHPQFSFYAILSCWSVVKKMCPPHWTRSGLSLLSLLSFAISKVNYAPKKELNKIRILIWSHVTLLICIGNRTRPMPADMKRCSRSAPHRDGPHGLQPRRGQLIVDWHGKVFPAFGSCSKGIITFLGHRSHGWKVRWKNTFQAWDSAPDLRKYSLIRWLPSGGTARSMDCMGQAHGEKCWAYRQASHVATPLAAPERPSSFNRGL